MQEQIVIPSKVCFLSPTLETLFSSELVLPRWIAFRHESTGRCHLHGMSETMSKREVISLLKQVFIHLSVDTFRLLVRE